MSYVEQHLLNGERVSFHTHLHWKVYAAPVLLSLLVFLPLTLWAAASENRIIVVLPLAAIALLILMPYLQRRSSEFAVTNKRVIVKVGVLSTRSVELLLSKVEGITVTQDLMGKLFGYGEIVITGSGGTKEQFAGIQAPFEFRRAVQSATDTNP
jgi:uncharacterized membrane protein YdbT with pleckstrin-like domain